MTATLRPVEVPSVIPELGDGHRLALAALIRPGWRNRAICADRPEVDWFADDQAAAIRICRVCPVRLSCLASGLLGDEFGIWGGTTEEDRDQLRFDLWFGVGS